MTSNGIEHSYKNVYFWLLFLFFLIYVSWELCHPINQLSHGGIVQYGIYFSRHFCFQYIALDTYTHTQRESPKLTHTYIHIQTKTHSHTQTVTHTHASFDINMTRFENVLTMKVNGREMVGRRGLLRKIPAIFTSPLRLAKREINVKSLSLTSMSVHSEKQPRISQRNQEKWHAVCHPCV